jgi:hypothetical protein
LTFTLAIPRSRYLVYDSENQISFSASLTSSREVANKSTDVFTSGLHIFKYDALAPPIILGDCGFMDHDIYQPAYKCFNAMFTAMTKTRAKAKASTGATGKTSEATSEGGTGASWAKQTAATSEASSGTKARTLQVNPVTLDNSEVNNKALPLVNKAHPVKAKIDTGRRNPVMVKRLQ